MSAGILELDKGIVNGTTWHGLPQYVQQEGPVSMEQAQEVLNVPVAKEQLQLADGQKVGAFALTRLDTAGKRVVLFPAVGTDYKVLDNSFVLRRVNEMILQVNPKVTIDSVGTLWNGQRIFINLHLDTFEVKGDKSPQITKVLISNMHGGGGGRACGHTHRVVCDNTRRMAELEGLTNKTFRVFRHTIGIEEAVTEYAADLSNYYTGLSEMKEKLNVLAESQMDTEAVQAFLSRLFPGDLRVKPTQSPATEEEKLSRMERNAVENRAAIMQQLESDQDLSPEARYSRYGMLQAVTWWCDHARKTRTLDEGGRWWDGMFGDSDAIKQDAMEYLMKDALAISASSVSDTAVRDDDSELSYGGLGPVIL